MLDPNLVVPDHAPGHGHGHGHGHGGDHEHPAGQQDRPDHDSVVDGADGRDVRAAKDAPGRHDEAYYGSPTVAAGAVRRPGVGTGQGGRSFAANLNRGRRGHDKKR